MYPEPTVYPERLVASRRVARACSFVLLVLGALACGSDDEPPPKPGPVTQPPAQTVASRNPVVKFKGGAAYARDLARALKIERSELCLELGQFDCIEDVHRVTLGGVDPYEGGVYEPLPRATVTAPIALDRVALSACSLRADRDFGDPAAAAIFIASDGGQESTKARTIAVDRLYQGLLLRVPSADERGAVVGLYEDLSGDDRGRRWAKLACFAIATTTEAAFY